MVVYHLDEGHLVVIGGFITIRLQSSEISQTLNEGPTRPQGKIKLDLSVVHFRGATKIGQLGLWRGQNCFLLKSIRVEGDIEIKFGVYQVQINFK